MSCKNYWTIVSTTPSEFDPGGISPGRFAVNSGTVRRTKSSPQLFELNPLQLHSISLTVRSLQ